MHFAQLYCRRPCWFRINDLSYWSGSIWLYHYELINVIHELIRISPDFPFEVIPGAVVVVRTYFKFGEGHYLTGSPNNSSSGSGAACAVAPGDFTSSPHASSCV